MLDRTFYVTTPIYYVNDKPHLGHSYTTIMCDILRRYYDLLGYETFMLTGTDEHGQNIVRVAEAAGRDVRAMVDENAMNFRNLWPSLNIRNDDFIRTTEPRHKRVVQTVLQTTYDRGDIYLAEYGGNYCVRCERFYTDTETEAKPGYCTIHETPLEYIKETNYFFRLGKYQNWLRDKIEGDPDFLRPAQFRSEVLALLREPLEDLCISRPVERLSWGIPLPFNPKFVTYVWYDALLNYLTGIGYPDGDVFARFWPNSTHVIAKDILRQHAVYWPCMLKAAGVEPFRRLRVHGWWTVEGKKMSKSLGNVIDPLEQAKKYGLDVYRYFLAREMTFGADGDYSVKALVARNNAELANDLGNLLSRVTAMIHKYCGGKMPEMTNPTADDTALLSQLDHLVEDLPKYLEHCTVHAFLEKVMAVVNAANGYVTTQEPWALAKAGKTERVGTVLAVAARMLAGAGQILYPVMPEKMTDLLASLGLSKPAVYQRDPIRAGVAIAPTQSLFPRLEHVEPGTGPGGEAGVASPAGKSATTAAGNAAVAAGGSGAARGSGAAAIKPEIAYDDFARVDLRVATVLEAERVPKTDKLMRMTIDIGAERRQIVAGIAACYAPEQLVGRQIIVVANLASRQLKGIASRGMLLAGRSGDTLFLLRPDESLPPGAEVS